jgi:DNA-binding response OmpR family regulator
MPGLSGPNLVREIRKVKKQVPIIVLSGLPDANADYDGMDIIFRQKPILPQDLIKLIRDLTTARAA